MNREQITPEIIELARKLYAAGYRKEIGEGDWCLNGMNDPRIILADEHLVKFIERNNLEYYIPIPTLTEILDWLLNKTGFLSILTAHIDRKYRWACVYNQNIGDSTEAPTPTEAAMLAMIKILGGDDE